MPYKWTNVHIKSTCPCIGRLYRGYGFGASLIPGNALCQWHNCVFFESQVGEGEIFSLRHSSQRTCWNPDMTSGRCRSCSGTRMSPPPWFTPMRWIGTADGCRVLAICVLWISRAKEGISHGNGDDPKAKERAGFYLCFPAAARERIFWAWRCCSNPGSSISNPFSLAINRVRSIGNPKVS